MDTKTEQLIEALKKNPAAAEALFHTQDGQRLLQLMTQGGTPALEQAAAGAARGDPAAMIRLVSEVLRSPEGAELARRISKAAMK